MGHSDIQTTMIYVHHVPKTAAAAELSAAVSASVATAVTGHDPVEVTTVPADDDV